MALDLKLVLYRGVTGLMKLNIIIVETFWHSGEHRSQVGRLLEVKSTGWQEYLTGMQTQRLLRRKVSQVG